MKFLLPLILALLGTGGGVGAAMFLRPDPTPLVDNAENPCGDPVAIQPVAAPDPDMPLAEPEYAQFSNQFIVPVIENEVLTALVVVTLNLELAAGTRDLILLHEPKLRDVFLQVLFDHANLGGFNGAFTGSAPMRNLRNSLRVAGQDAVGDRIIDVLIVDIVRQDV